ncbi:MAG: alpha/beta hydrolase [Pseudomonadota bacterium]
MFQVENWLTCSQLLLATETQETTPETIVLKLQCLTACIASFLFISGCTAVAHDPLTFIVANNQILVNGEVDRSAIRAFSEITAQNPDIKTLVLQNVGGSVDDEANLELGRMVRKAGFTTIVPSNGLVASGGTDLFLAGKKRVLEQGACVGVHSWGGDVEGSELPRASQEHLPYLQYYEVMSIPAEFYWFTLNSASASEIHWMQQAETNRFNMTTDQAPKLGEPNTCDLR